MYQRWHDATAVIHLLMSSNIKCKIMQSSDGMSYLSLAHTVSMNGQIPCSSCTTWVEFTNASSRFNWKVFVNSSFLISTMPSCGTFCVASTQTLNQSQSAWNNAARLWKLLHT